MVFYLTNIHTERVREMAGAYMNDEGKKKKKGL